jgi:hypothetical protein
MSPPKPRAKVKRVFDARPLSEPPPRLKVRGFLESFERERGASALVLQGTLQGSTLEVSILGLGCVVLSGQAGQDEHGAFLWLGAEERRIGDHHALRIDADAHDADVSHAAITYFELPEDLAARSELAYAARWYSVYFNPLGLVDGVSSGGPGDTAPAPLLS